MRSFVTATLVLAAAATIVSAQTIDPGMTRDQVVAKLGKPLTERSKDGRTYLFYDNKMVTKVGMNDLVILENDKVVDAIFRAKDRHYSGTSSSPDAIPADVAYYGKNPPPRKAAPAASKTSAKETAAPAKAAPANAKAAPPATKTPAKSASPTPATKTPPPPAKTTPAPAKGAPAATTPAKGGAAPTKTPPAPAKKGADTSKKAPAKKP